MKNNNAFVFVVCGERHAARVNVALRFLRHFSKSEIIVVKGRSSLKVGCDRVIEPRIPGRMNNREASIFLKTSLHRILADGPRRLCYLDSDVIAVNGRVDEVFNHARPPISFAADHCDLRGFSRYAVNCGCASGKCEHLHAAIGELFGVGVREKAWRHWNGGVFVFDKSSAGFMELWHQNTLAILNNRYWQPRDQGSLAATVWKLGLQDHPTLPREFNFIVDPFDGKSQAGRRGLRARELLPNEKYSLNGDAARPRPSLLHLINDGVGRRGWKNWDDVDRLLTPDASAAAPAPNGAGSALKRPRPPRRADALSAENHHVHSLWIGSTLSKLELLTIKSFIRHGHAFHLWLYQDIATPLPSGVILEDANEIIPQSRIIQKADTDRETGVGKGSFSSPFSDLFRYKLLYEKGGYWVDMDVTCLRPFNFATPFVFRAHRVGVVGNIIKCPRHSDLMKAVYERVASKAGPDSQWLMPNRALSRTVRRLGLAGFVRTGIWNEESWWHTVRPLALGDMPIPPAWSAIHWINEFWRTLQQTGGVYRGRRLFEVVPDKESPKPASALARLYAEYGLAPPHDAKMAPCRASGTATDGRIAGSSHSDQGRHGPVPCTPGGAIHLKEARLPATNGHLPGGPGGNGAAPEIPLNKAAARQPRTFAPNQPQHINILVASMAIGGAERSVHDLLTGLEQRRPTGKLFLMHNLVPSYPLEGTESFPVIRLGAMDRAARMRTVALEVLASPSAVLYTHLIHAADLRMLWDYGVTTIPVIQNSAPGWQDPPEAYAHERVPFLIAVSEDVRRQLAAAGCGKPVVVLRHELQRWRTADQLAHDREEIRRRHGIRSDTLLMGMVGQFKSHKAYTRAARVLQGVLGFAKAKLMIIGGWDHDYGAGRITYTATMKLALDLGVLPDLLVPGPVHPVEPYYAAFDLFLNTSIYEGLSVATLEAAQSGCPIVAADVGGQREAVPSGTVLIDDPSDIDAYVAAIQAIVRNPVRRAVIPPPPAPDLVPRLWCMIAQHGVSHAPREGCAAADTLFVTNNLNPGGTQRSLTNLLTHLNGRHRAWLCVLGQVLGDHFIGKLESAGVPIVGISAASTQLDRMEQLLELIGRLGVRTICFWNVEAPVKLLVAKVLALRAIRLIDVSPGPMLFAELDGAAEFQRRIAFSAAEYLGRLDCFVAKYHGGEPPARYGAQPRHVAVVPNGVPLPGALPRDRARVRVRVRPPAVDPRFALITCCRIVPSKRIEFLLEMMRSLGSEIPEASLTIIGGVDQRHIGYWESISAKVRELGLGSVHFAGPNADIFSFLGEFRAFVMVSDAQGCPNASLEAMAAGLPVVGNADGGTAEQIEHGRTGYLVSGKDPSEMARRVASLLRSPEQAQRFGLAGRRRVESFFSMETMTDSYLRLVSVGGEPQAAHTEHEESGATHPSN